MLPGLLGASRKTTSEESLLLQGSHESFESIGVEAAQDEPKQATPGNFAPPAHGKGTNYCRQTLESYGIQSVFSEGGQPSPNRGFLRRVKSGMKKKYTRLSNAVSTNSLYGEEAVFLVQLRQHIIIFPSRSFRSAQEQREQDFDLQRHSRQAQERRIGSRSRREGEPLPSLPLPPRREVPQGS